MLSVMACTPGPFLCPSCVPKKMGVKQNGVNQKLYERKKNIHRNVRKPAKGFKPKMEGGEQIRKLVETCKER